MASPSLHSSALLALIVLVLVAFPSRGSDDAAPAPTVSSVTHINVKSSKSFDAVTKVIESQLGKYEAQAVGALLRPPVNVAEVESKIHAMEGSSGLMLFAVRDHGQLLALKGKKTLARQYEIGNPLVALEMTQWDVRAGEYAPLRIFVYVGDDNQTHVDYDLPSTIFGRLHSAQVDKVAQGLDQKVEMLVANAIKN
jgi:uncharacterized protein (DUF302 family)